MRPERPPTPWASWIDYDRARDDQKTVGVGYAVVGPDGLARRVDPMKVLVLDGDADVDE